MMRGGERIKYRWEPATGRILHEAGLVPEPKQTWWLGTQPPAIAPPFSPWKPPHHDAQARNGKNG